MKKILSIDGGGIKGAFPAAFLAELEEQLGEPIVSYFDLIVGTSTGGIIALGLGMGFSAKEITTFYEKYGPNIFQPKNQGIMAKVARKVTTGYSDMLFDTKYDAKALKVALYGLFGDRIIGDSQVRLVIPSFNIQSGTVRIYKTRHHPRFELDWKKSVVEAALATAAAPLYFQTFRTESGVPLIDGGVYANNPVGLAAVEAIGVLKWQPEELRILSLGCTEEPLDINLEKEHLGAADWKQGLIEVFMRSQSSSSYGIATLLADNHIHNNVYKINPTTPPKLYSLDGVNRIGLLKALADETARYEIAELRKRGFFAERAEPFIPIPLQS
ncbi:CBASS cGAMP-activated phospholipase [Paenibacillus ehimensis]|uniref:CBASS cGAMP-activated phospholipase n=1 Tax=Paenibacillus ehimensis TaxID=79264 RepID=A0ABT8VC72_9BACL|nr:CBASS cGAMP-activated phospholipase [Paenibacillus ehimensis]MDO3678554.1 CBASS cGAMP-activated phospholipase [Paenibacillus ehimensis]